MFTSFLQLISLYWDLELVLLSKFKQQRACFFQLVCVREREFSTPGQPWHQSMSRDSKETDLKEIIKVDKFLSIPVTNLHILEKET